MDETVLLEAKAAGVEFGSNLVRGVYYSRLIKKFFGNQVRIKVYSYSSYDKELADQFCDELICCERQELKGLQVPYSEIKGFWERKDNPFRKQGAWHPDFDWGHCQVDRQTSPYVCFIAVLSEKWGLSRPWGRGRTLPFEYWLELKKIVNSYGLKVVLLGSRKPCDSGFDKKANCWRDIADEIDMREDFENQSEYLNHQLKVMNGARLTIATGGACYIPLTFSLPVIAADPFVSKDKNSFPRQARFHQRDDVSLLNIKPETHEETYDFIKNALIDRLNSPL